MQHLDRAGTVNKFRNQKRYVVLSTMSRFTIVIIPISCLGLVVSSRTTRLYVLALLCRFFLFGGTLLLLVQSGYFVLLSKLYLFWM